MDDALQRFSRRKIMRTLICLTLSTFTLIPIGCGSAKDKSKSRHDPTQEPGNQDPTVAPPVGEATSGAGLANGVTANSEVAAENTATPIVEPGKAEGSSGSLKARKNFSVEKYSYKVDNSTTNNTYLIRVITADSPLKD